MATVIFRGFGASRLRVVMILLTWIGPAFCDEIHDAAKSGDVEKVKALLNDNPALISSKSVGVEAETPLHFAAAFGQKNVVEVLLANKAEIDARDGSGMTPLDRAILAQRVDMVQMLLGKGASIKSKDNAGQTPLHWAMGGPDEVVKLLLAKGADVNASAGNGETPLHTAAKLGSRNSAVLLLANKANVNARTQDGSTPLHLAVLSRDVFGGSDEKAIFSMVELLLANKADVDAKDNGGSTALSWAISRGHKEVADLLRKHGGH